MENFHEKVSHNNLDSNQFKYLEALKLRLILTVSLFIFIIRIEFRYKKLIRPFDK